MGKTESFVVMSPQLSKKYSAWQPFYTDEMIKYAKANLNIDPNRIFVTGLSMGGGGTWNFASSSQVESRTTCRNRPGGSAVHDDQRLQYRQSFIAGDGHSRAATIKMLRQAAQ